MDQPRKVAKPARGQKNKEIKCPCRYISGNMYIYMYNNTRTAVRIYLFIYQVYFLFGGMYIRARFTAVYGYMCNYSGMYVEPMYVCMYVFIKLHLTTQSGPVILVILCHSH